MAPTQARCPYAPSIWSPLTSPNPIMESLIDNETNMWTFRADDFWQANQNLSSSASQSHQPLQPPPTTREYFVPTSANSVIVENNQLCNDLEKLLADCDDLSGRKERPASERLPISRLQVNHLPFNQPLVNRFPVNQLPNRRLPTFRGLSGSSTDVSPSSSVGERPQSSKSLAEKEYDAYYRTFDQADDTESDDLQIDCSWSGEGRLSAGFKTPDSDYASYTGTPFSSRTNSASSSGVSVQPNIVKVAAQPTVAVQPAVSIKPATVACTPPRNYRSELIHSQREWTARISVSEHQRLSFLLSIMNDNRIHVSNIPFDYTTADLFNFYWNRKYGLIYEVELISNERGSKGFGFLSFENGWIALRARLETDGLAVPYKTKPGTRVLEVNRANPKKRFQEQSN